MTDRTSGGTQTQRVTYTYEAFNRLARRTYQTTSGSPVTTGFFIHDGDQIVLELDAGGGVAHRLLWGPAVDQALADETGSGDVYWYLTDHLGTVRDVVDYTGGATIVNHIAYDSFGRRTSETNSALGDFDLGFTGKWFDRATGLQWNLNRWYNPEIQRWMSEDPIGFAAGDANLNRYVGNEPTGWTDPSGLHGEQGGGESDESWYERQQKLAQVDPWWNDSWRDWFSLGAYSLFRWIPELTAHGIKQRAAEIERDIRRGQQKRALESPQTADLEALRPYASESEIQLMEEYAEAGIQYNAAALGGAFGYFRSGMRVFPTRANSGLTSQALRAEQKAFFLRGLQAGKHPAELRGQAAAAGYTRRGGAFSNNDRLMDRGAEKALQDALREFRGG